MPRKPSFYWEVERGVYRTDTGGKTKRFPGIARDDHARIGIAFDEYLRELDAAERPPEPTVDDLCLLFVKACTSGRGVSGRTARSHKERLTVFSEFAPDEKTPIIGSRPASTLAARDLKNAIRHWEQEGLSGHYRAGICRSVKAAWAWAATEDGGYILKANPMAEVRAAATGRSPERYSDRREIAAFLRFLWRRAGAAPGIYRRFGRMLALMVRTAWHAGARPGDLAAAWRDDYDPEPMSITLPPERHKTGRKTGRSRVIFLTPMLVRASIACWRWRTPPGLNLHPQARQGQRRSRERLDVRPKADRAASRRAVGQIRHAAEWPAKLHHRHRAALPGDPEDSSRGGRGSQASQEGEAAHARLGAHPRRRRQPLGSLPAAPHRAERQRHGRWQPAHGCRATRNIGANVGNHVCPFAQRSPVGDCGGSDCETPGGEG